MKKIAIAVAITALALGAAYGWGQHKQQQMDEYASANNCTWQYSEYIDRDPVCK